MADFPWYALVPFLLVFFLFGPPLTYLGWRDRDHPWLRRVERSLPLNGRHLVRAIGLAMFLGGWGLGPLLCLWLSGFRL